MLNTRLSMHVHKSISRQVHYMNVNVEASVVFNFKYCNEIFGVGCGTGYDTQAQIFKVSTQRQETDSPELQP